MTRRPLPFRPSLAAAAGLVALLAPSLAIADTCTGLSLAALTPVNVGTNPVAVAVGDFNRDGRLDVATANSGSNDVGIVLSVGWSY